MIITVIFKNLLRFVNTDLQNYLIAKPTVHKNLFKYKTEVEEVKNKIIIFGKTFCAKLVEIQCKKYCTYYKLEATWNLDYLFNLLSTARKEILHQNIRPVIRVLTF